MRWFQLLRPALVGLAFFINGCEQAAAPVVQLQGPTMGSTYHLTLVAPPGGLPVDAQAQIDALLADVDQTFSTYRNDSELARFNQQQTTAAVAVSPPLIEVAREALRIGAASGGALDVTVGPLLKLWGFGGQGVPATIPPQEQIDQVRQLTGLDKFELGEGTYRKKLAGLSLDFSSVVAGYAADRMAVMVERWGVTNYLLELTGEMRVKGSHPAGRPWRIAVEKPVAGTERHVERVVELHDIGVATSGDYRNFYLVDGKRYSHTINPQTARPIDHLMVSVTVLHPSAMTADGWATAFMAMGPERAKAVAEEQELAVLLILKEGEQFVEWSSPAMNPYLSSADSTVGKE